ncbi:hypothetical protein DRN73_04180, partial [Candidatus Pacearchaeota archaeon]
GAGIGRYYSSLLKEFAKRNIKIYTEVPLKYKKEFLEEFQEVLNNIKVYFVSYEKFSIKALFLQSLKLKKLKKIIRIYFYPHVNLPFYVPKNLIVTIHDLRPFTSFWDRSKIKKSLLDIFYKRSLSKAKKIIAVSKTTKKDILKYFPQVQEEKIKVIYNFIDNKFYTFPKSSNRIVKDEYLLYVGKRKKHKNLEMLIKAYSLIKDKIDCKLVIAGGKESAIDEVDKLKNKLKLFDKIIEFISPDDKTIINLYDNALAFVFPSLYEGFGFPPLEAMARGCPVVASNIKVIKEICKDAVLYLNPYSINDMAQKLLQIINFPSLREELKNKGFERLKKFNTDIIISEYIKIFNSLV